ncbi:uncharacterized protein LOC129893141 [Solanum dulcamara]|uniref:uncharacterized protein LOC129893141 n=1 Tax=Solanum dulcamara TaxID=45834 RepID=UPI00248526DB|nr:uncharacterized protein LOC129893141 [Solanum dulcamara]
MPTGENSDHISQEPNNLFLLAKIIFNSFKIFFSTKKISFYIFFFLSFPLSFFLFLLSFLTFPLKNRIQHLEEISLFSSIQVESKHLLEEANKEAKSLLFLKLLFFFPTFLLSFFTVVATVNIAFSICSNGKPTVMKVFTTVKAVWIRVLVTTTCIYATMLACTVMPGMLVAFLETRPFVRVVIEILGSGLELHLMGVMSLALVVSINEGMYGFDAIRFGSGLMEGKWVCGWVLSGLFVLFSGFIRDTMEMAMAMAMDGSDFERVESTVVINLLWDNVVWILLYALVVQWSCVATTVFYFDLKKRDSIKSDRDSEISLV